MIKFEGVNKIYEDGYHALKNLNLEFKEGKINVLIGPSGCGKTTTMKMVNRLIEHTDGTISINGKDINQIDPIRLRRSIGYVIQSIGLFPHMNIYDNVATVPKLLKWDKQKIDKRVEELLHLVNLDPKIFKKRFPSELSGGQQQRIGVIRALAAEPSIILMDEPFSALDPISREQLQDELVRLQKEIKKTIIFVTHDMDEALKIADQIILMKDGKIEQMGSPYELLQNPASEFVKEFIGSERMEQAKGLPSIKESMSPVPITIKINQTINESIEIMLNHQLDYAPVVNKHNKYVGTLSLFQALKNPGDTVENLVETNGFVCTIEDHLETLLNSWRDKAVKDLYIIDKNNLLIGVISRRKLFTLLQDSYLCRNGENEEMGRMNNVSNF